MKKAVVFAALLFLIGCSSKEKAENTHMLKDEKNEIEKAESAVQNIGKASQNAFDEAGKVSEE